MLLFLENINFHCVCTHIVDISSILPNYRSDDDEDQGDYDGGGRLFLSQVYYVLL